MIAEITDGGLIVMSIALVLMFGAAAGFVWAITCEPRPEDRETEDRGRRTEDGKGGLRSRFDPRFTEGDDER